MMPNGIMSPGWRAVLLGSTASVEDLVTFVLLEEGMPEGALMLARLDFAKYPSPESVDQINLALADAGVAACPGALYYTCPAPDGTASSIIPYYFFSSARYFSGSWSKAFLQPTAQK